MSWLILGLVIFLGVHSVRIVAEGWRSQTIAKWGELPWKGACTLASILGFALIVWGFSLARHDSSVLWNPPRPMRHIAALLVLISFIFLTAAYVPGNAIKAKLRHPMILSVKVWALAHLLANGRLADVVLFGAFLVWAVLDFRSVRQRDRDNGVVTAVPPAGLRTVLTVVIGVVAWAVFAMWGHLWLIGVSPLG